MPQSRAARVEYECFGLAEVLIEVDFTAAKEEKGAPERSKVTAETDTLRFQSIAQGIEAKCRIIRSTAWTGSVL